MEDQKDEDFIRRVSQSVTTVQISIVFNAKL